MHKDKIVDAYRVLKDNAVCIFSAKVAEEIKNFNSKKIYVNENTVGIYLLSLLMYLLLHMLFLCRSDHFCRFSVLVISNLCPLNWLNWFHHIIISMCDQFGGSLFSSSCALTVFYFTVILHEYITT